MRAIKKGSTDQSVVIRIIDATAFTPETAVEHNTSGIALWYRREGATTTAITEAALAALDSAHSDGGIEHIGDGYYRLDLPDAAVDTGANGVTVGGTVTGMIVIGCYVHLVDYDPQDTVRMGCTSLPNAAAAASGGLIINGSNSGNVEVDALTITGAMTNGSTVLGNTTMGTLTQTGAASLGAGSTVTFGALTVTANTLFSGTTTYTGAVSYGSTETHTGALVTNITGTVSGNSTHTAANVVTAMGTGTFLTAVPWNAAWDAEVQSECTDALNSYDAPTNTEMVAAFTEVKGATWATTDTLEAIRDRGDAAWVTGTATSTLTAGQVRTELATELGRIDVAVSSRGTGTALDAAGVRTAVGMASANLDTQIGTLATASALTTLDTLVDRLAPLLVGNVTGAGTGTEVYSYGGVTATVTVDVDGNVSGVVFS